MSKYHLWEKYNINKTSFTLLMKLFPTNGAFIGCFAGMRSHVNNKTIFLDKFFTTQRVKNERKVHLIYGILNLINFADCVRRF